VLAGELAEIGADVELVFQFVRQLLGGDVNVTGSGSGHIRYS
jgi:long-subunit acyl-CoA synthetase (AMP-forming)